MKEKPKKKGGKITLLLALLFIIVGGGIAAFGMYSLDWDIFALDTQVYTEATLSPSSENFQTELTDGKLNITKASIKVKGWSVVVTNGDEFKLEYFTTEKTKINKIELSGGELKIDIEEKFDYVQLDPFNNIGRSVRAYKLTVPSGISLELDFTDSEGNLDGAAYENFVLNSVNGDWSIKNSAFNTLDIDCVNGDLIFDGCTVSSLTQIDGTNVDVKTIFSQFGDFKLDVVNSDFIIEKSSFSSVVFESVNGSLITLGFIDCKAFTFDSVNGNFNLILTGSKNDIKEVKFDAVNHNVRIDDEKQKHNYSGAGDISIVAEGVNLTLKITFYAVNAAG